MLDFETPTYVTAKEAQHMQSQVNNLSGISSADATHFPTARLSLAAPLSSSLTCIVLLLVARWMSSSCLCYAYRMFLRDGESFYSAFITPRL